MGSQIWFFAASSAARVRVACPNRFIARALSALEIRRSRVRDAQEAIRSSLRASGPRVGRSS